MERQGDQPAHTQLSELSTEEAVSLATPQAVSVSGLVVGCLLLWRVKKPSV